MTAIYVKVKIEIPEGANPEEVVSEMDYQMSYEGVDLVTEIQDIVTKDH